MPDVLTNTEVSAHVPHPQEVKRIDFAAMRTELGEKLGKFDSDIAIVFGEGPVKDIVFSDEMTPQQKAEWDAFTAEGPQPIAHRKEPSFRVIDVSPHGADSSEPNLDKNPYYSMMQDIEKEAEAIPDEKLKADTIKANRDVLRQNWQEMPYYSKRRYGEMNALAAGYLLLGGKTKEIIFTGGRTISPEKRSLFTAEFQQTHPEWKQLANYQEELDKYIGEQTKDLPSEAELMRDKVIASVGKLLFETDPEKTKYASYEDYIDMLKRDKLKVEPNATNTITNIVNSAANFPEILDPDKKIGIVTTSHHTQRSALLYERFAGIRNTVEVPSQAVLDVVSEVRKHPMLANIVDQFELSEAYDRNVPASERIILNKLGEINPDLVQKLGEEEKMIVWMQAPERLSFWLPQAIDAFCNMKPELGRKLLQQTFDYLKAEPSRLDYANKYFNIVGEIYRRRNTSGVDSSVLNNNISEMSPADMALLGAQMREFSDYKNYRQFSIDEIIQRNSSLH